MSGYFLHDRYATASESTVSNLWWMADDKATLICFLLEDQYQENKVPGETCIPTGTYELGLVKDSPMAKKYMKKYPWCIGLPWIKDVPGFSLIRVHPGNTDDDTEGCPLTGDGLEEVEGGWKIAGGTSTPAFKRLCVKYFYPAIEQGPVKWQITDHRIRL